MNAGPWTSADRFLMAQEPVYPQVLRELRAGLKQTHWMWFVFPQIAGLGSSDMAIHYALSDLEAARAYLAHPVLGSRLRECTGLVLSHGPESATPKNLARIFDTPDDLKFCSSMTLFNAAAPEDIFETALDVFCAGRQDRATLDRL